MDPSKFFQAASQATNGDDKLKESFIPPIKKLSALPTKAALSSLVDPSN